jgi:deferrochelatase/peroxidase EfeB
VAGAGAARAADPSTATPGPATTGPTNPGPVVTAPAGPTEHGIEPFHGDYQGGIITQVQRHSYFAAFSLTAKTRAEVVTLLRTWTDAAARMTKGDTARPLGTSIEAPPADSGDALGLPPSRLTITFGFGPGLFSKNGVDRYALAAQRPEPLVDMPAFNGDQLIEAQTGGDLSIQACADDQQVAFHAVRQLARLAYGAAQFQWTQSGFLPTSAAEATPRNLMGFKDGTINAGAPYEAVWVGQEGPGWMRNGSYLVTRRIRISLEHWDRTDLDFQEQVIGRHKYSGAPLGGKNEFDPLDLAATDGDGNPIIAENAHVRLAAPAVNDGAQILRRAYSYNDGLSFTAERWPPWRQGMMYDAGLFFIAYQRDPRTGFIRIFENMAKLDALNQYTTHVGSGMFACPGGVREGSFIGQGLFESA